MCNWSMKIATYLPLLCFACVEIEFSARIESYMYMLGSQLCLVRLVWFVVDEYYCSETITAMACLWYVSLGHSRAARHTCADKGQPA